MANAVLMPKAGITVESCIISQWEKKVGDKIAVGDILFNYETDKASFECESTAEGELLEIFFQNGDEVPCLVNVCAIGEKGRTVPPCVLTAQRPRQRLPQRPPPLRRPRLFRRRLPRKPLPPFPARQLLPERRSWRSVPVWTPLWPLGPVPTGALSSAMCAG